MSERPEVMVFFEFGAATGAHCVAEGMSPGAFRVDAAAVKAAEARIEQALALLDAVEVLDLPDDAFGLEPSTAAAVVAAAVASTGRRRCQCGQGAPSPGYADGCAAGDPYCG